MALAAALALSGGLAACASLKEAIGATKNPPDEFAVVTKAPLVVPPEFSLRPPEPGAPRPQELAPSAAAQQTVFGLPRAPTAPSPGTSEGEAILLAMAGADRADPNIRQVIDSETLALGAKDEGLADRVLFWKGEGRSDKVIDAGAEAERIRTDEASGATVTGSATPESTDAGKADSDGEKQKTEARDRGGLRGWLQEILPF